MSPTLRAATPGDCVALARLHAASFAEPWTAGELTGLLTSSGVFGFVADAGGEAKGFILCRAAADEAEILTIAVNQDNRRGGLGAALVEISAALAKAMGVQALFLEVAVDNTAALKLYDSTGFAHAGLRRGYYRRAEGASIDALVLRRDLTA